MQLLSDLFPAPPPLHGDAAAVKIHWGWGSLASPLDVAWLSGEPVQGPELLGNELWGLSDAASALPAHRAGMVGGQGSLGTHGRSRQCSNSSAEPHFQLHLAQEHKHSLMDWRQNGNHGSCPSFWMGNIPCFLGKGAKPCSRDSGLWENGGRGVPGACAGNCERGEESPFCL